MSNWFANPSFETNSGCGTFNWCPITVAPNGWQLNSIKGELNSVKDFTPHDGSWSMDLSADSPYSISQTLSLEPGVYSLEFFIRPNTHCGKDDKSKTAVYSISGGSLGNGQPNSQCSVSIGASDWISCKDTINVPLDSTSQKFTIGGDTLSTSSCGAVLDDLRLVQTSKLTPPTPPPPPPPVIPIPPSSPTPSPPPSQGNTVDTTPAPPVSLPDSSQIPDRTPTTSRLQLNNTAAVAASNLENATPNSLVSSGNTPSSDSNEDGVTGLVPVTPNAFPTVGKDEQPYTIGPREITIIVSVCILLFAMTAIIAIFLRKRKFQRRAQSEERKSYSIESLEVFEYEEGRSQIEIYNNI